MNIRIYSSVSHKLIMERIVHAHHANQTFTIKINDFSAYSGSSKVRRRSKERSTMAELVNAVAGMDVKEMPLNTRESIKMPPKKISYNKA